MLEFSKVYETMEKKNINPKASTSYNMVHRTTTKETQTILDPFMGSGTTGVACVKTRPQVYRD